MPRSLPLVGYLQNISRLPLTCPTPPPPPYPPAVKSWMKACYAVLEYPLTVVCARIPPSLWSVLEYPLTVLEYPLTVLEYPLTVVYAAHLDPLTVVCAAHLHPLTVVCAAHLDPLTVVCAAHLDPLTVVSARPGVVEPFSVAIIAGTTLVEV